MKRAFTITKTQIINGIYIIYIPIKHIVKHKTAIYILAALFFTILFDSCKTCKCPAYSQNNTSFEELETEKINIFPEDSLFAMQNTMHNIKLNH